MKKFIIIILISHSSTSCNSKNKSDLNRLVKINKSFLIKIDSLQRKTDSLQLQVKKCDNWVTYLESE